MRLTVPSPRAVGGWALRGMLGPRGSPEMMVIAFRIIRLVGYVLLLAQVGSYSRTCSALITLPFDVRWRTLQGRSPTPAGSAPVGLD